MYEDAGADMPCLGDVGDLRGGQRHKGGAHDKGGRPVGTRRFTRETLTVGCRKAMAVALSQYGEERFLERIKARSPCSLSVESLSQRLSEMEDEACRGEVWPLMHVFGFFSKFEGGMASVAQENNVACTWVGRDGYIKCSCLGKTRLIALMRRPAADTEDVKCTHGVALAKTLRKLARTLGVDLRSLRAVVGSMHARCRSRMPDAVEGDGGDDGDCERFVVGQSVFGIAVTGYGDQVLAAPVRFTRQTTTCMLCDTARSLACSHVSLTRHFKRSADARQQCASSRHQKDTEAPMDDAADRLDATYSEEDVVQSVSQKPMGMFNCHEATSTDVALGELVAKGGVFHIPAPSCCPKCKSPRGSAADIGSNGVIMASAGPCKCMWTATRARQPRAGSG